MPLTARGEANARSLGERLKGETFDLVFVSPLGRARRTCELAGFGDRAVTAMRRPARVGLRRVRGPDDGRDPRERPGWYLFRDGCPGGESVRGRRCPRRPRRGSPQSGPRPRHPLRPWPLLPRPGRALAGPAAGGRAATSVLGTAALSILGLRAHAGRTGHPPLE